VLDAIGVYGDGSTSADHGTREFVIVVGIIALAALIVFGWLVPRLARREALGVPALTLSVLGLLSVLAFWSGLPPTLAAGGALLGWAGRDGADRRLCRAAIGVGVLAVAADLAAYLLDLTSS
jgi:hypothetical protein